MLPHDAPHGFRQGTVPLPKVIATFARRPAADTSPSLLVHTTGDAPAVRSSYGALDLMIHCRRPVIWAGSSVQVSQSSTALPICESASLGWLRELLGDSLDHGFVVHAGRDCYPLGE